MRVVVAPDSFGGILTARAAADAIRGGWRRARPDDELVAVPLADGGEGTLDVLRGPGSRLHRVEVADPLGRPTRAGWLQLADGSAVVESAQACGQHLLSADERDPLRATTYGVGQLLEDVRRAGVDRVAVGLGGSATVDGGAGALTALGLRVLREDGQGLKIGGGELRAVGAVREGWFHDGWSQVDVVLWHDVTTSLDRAATTFGPQKGASEDDVRVLAEGLERWASVVQRDLGGPSPDDPGTGAAGGLGFGLAAALAARAEPGADAVARLVGLERALEQADLIVTGEGRLDDTSAEGKVVAAVVAAARRHGVEAVAAVGRIAGSLEELSDVEAAAPDGPGDDPAVELAAAAERLAARR